MVPDEEIIVKAVLFKLKRTAIKLTKRSRKKELLKEEN